MGLRSKLIALTYDRSIAGSEEAGLGEIRARVLADATGDVLEIGAGTGLNLDHYGRGVRSLTMTEPDRSMLRRLERAAAGDPRPTTVLRSPAEDLPFDDDSFDTVVSTLVLCGVSDQPRAAREIRRVLRPEGRLLFVEHVRSDDAGLAHRQDRMNWLSRAVGGCDCNRATLQTLERTGFTTEELVATEFPKAPSFVRPLVFGTAVCPVAA